VPLLGFAQAGAGGFFDDAGFPEGQGWDLVELPVQPSDGSYALKVHGDSMLPLYRNGDVLIVNPAASVRKGDRVVVKTNGGEVMAKLLERQTAAAIELVSLNPAHPARTLPLTEVEWVARIVWASQ
ncbi:MAG: helix-turn-helix transcriptional regulator, partial [Rhizobiaceae bacterium]